jgi:transposase-like protein
MMDCPTCKIEMGYTYEPYERRCKKCGYWFDTYTGKEIDPVVAAYQYMKEIDRRKRRNGYLVRSRKPIRVGAGIYKRQFP